MTSSSSEHTQLTVQDKQNIVLQCYPDLNSSIITNATKLANDQKQKTRQQVIDKTQKKMQRLFSTDNDNPTKDQLNTALNKILLELAKPEDDSLLDPRAVTHNTQITLYNEGLIAYCFACLPSTAITAKQNLIELLSEVLVCERSL